MKKRTTLIAAITAALLALGGCGASNQSANDGTAGKTIITAYGVEPQATLIPGNTASTAGGKVLDLLFSQLTAFDAKGKLVNEVAESITPNDDASQYTIKIKKGWKFTDGTPVTAESFTKAWSYTANVTNAQINASYMSDIKGYDELQTEGVASDAQLSGLKVVDDNTFTVELNASNSVFPTKIGFTAFAPLPESFYKDPKAFGEKPVGNGAYKFESWRHNTEIKVVKNADYKGEFPAKNDGVTFKLYTSGTSAYADVQSGNLDVMDNVPATALKSFKSDPKVQAYAAAGSGIATFVIPGRLPHFSGEEGRLRRQALSMAINRQQIVDKILYGLGEPAKDFTAPVIQGYSEDIEGNDVLEYNPDKAKELWAKADAISKWEGPFRIAYNADGASNKDIFSAVTSQIKNTLGIDATTNPIPTSQEFGTSITDRKIETPYRLSWSPDYPAAEDYLKPLYSISAADGKGMNEGDYKNEDFDKLLDEAAKESDASKAEELYHQAEQILFTDLPAIPLYYTSANGVAAKGVKGVEFNWRNMPILQNVTK